MTIVAHFAAYESLQAVASYLVGMPCTGYNIDVCGVL
jgi:hypothetical protein